MLKKQILAASLSALLIVAAAAQEKTQDRFQTQSSSRDRWQKPDEVIRAMGLRPGQIVVDIGAGDGYFTRRFAAAVAPDGRAIGIDIDPSSIRSLMADAKRWGLANYEARLVPADDPMLEPQSVDVVFLCDTYHEIEKRVEYFSRVKKSLRAGGKLVVVDFVKDKDNPKHSIEKETVIEELRQAGYRLAREFDFLLPRQFFLEFETATGK
ncbi:MAG: methyltransferase domain-containing protein [Acidobacteriota bacterium]